MNKKCISLLLMVVISVFLGACGKTQAINSVADLDNILSISVTLNPPEQTIVLTDEQLEEVVNIFNDISVGEKDNSYQELNGQYVQFDITKEDGSVLSIAELSPYIIVDGIGYKCNDKDCETLNQFANDLLK